MASLEELFEKKYLLQNVDIKLSCYKRRNIFHLLALVTGDNEIIILVHCSNKTSPVIKRFPWINEKSVETICFHPTAKILLVGNEDSFLYAVPILDDENNLIWPIREILLVVENVCSNQLKPSALLWWCSNTLEQFALIGYQDGWIHAVNLQTKLPVDSCKIDGKINFLEIENSGDQVSLLIYENSRKSWRLYLEKRVEDSEWDHPSHWEISKFKYVRKISTLIPYAEANFVEIDYVKSDCILCDNGDYSDCHYKDSSSYYNHESNSNINELAVHFGFRNLKVLNIYGFTNRNNFVDPKNEDVLPDVDYQSFMKHYKLSKPSAEEYIVVTFTEVYTLSLRFLAVSKLIYFIIHKQLEKAKKLADIFRLNLMQVSEAYIDSLIENGFFKKGLKMCQITNIDPLSRIFKIKENSDGILKYSQICLSDRGSIINCNNKVKTNFGNIIVLSHLKKIYNADHHLKNYYKTDLLNFIYDEDIYDPDFVLNIAVEFKIWKIASYIAKTFGLETKLIEILSENIINCDPSTTDTSFVMALSDSDLTKSLFFNPKCCKEILRYVKKNLESFSTKALLRFFNQLDLNKNCTLWDNEDTNNNSKTEMVDTFLKILLHLVKKSKKPTYTCNINLLKQLRPVEKVASSHQQLNRIDTSTVSCGYGFAAIVRNEQLYTMGFAGFACLGVGITNNCSYPPQLVKTLAMKELKVWSVSCGRNHILTLTDLGVFSWGSNTYGQLGLSQTMKESSYPKAVSTLKYEQVVSVVAGDYHSMALTATGSVYTWGWGFFGQLGHRSTKNEFFPRLLDFNHFVVKIAAGHAHTLMLTSEKKVYSFGSNFLGEVGLSNFYGNKSTAPLQVIFDDSFIPIRDIAAGFLQSVAIREDIEHVYGWGRTPSIAAQRKNSKKGKEQVLHKVPIISYGTVNHKIRKIAVGSDYHVFIQKDSLSIFLNKRNCWNIDNYMNDNGCLNIFCGRNFVLAENRNKNFMVISMDSMMASILNGELKENVKEKLKKLYDHCHNDSSWSYTTILQLPTEKILFSIPEKKFQFQKTICNQEKGFHHLVFQKNLYLILENYFSHYSCKNYIDICLDDRNFHIASKLAVLNNQYGDSFLYLMKAIESEPINPELLLELMDFYTKCSPKTLSCNLKILKEFIRSCAKQNFHISLFETFVLKNEVELRHAIFDLILSADKSNLGKVLNEDDDGTTRQTLSDFYEKLSAAFKLQLYTQLYTQLC